MPSTYAHYIFGEEVYRNTPNEIKKIIKENYDLYLIGLHGPDILFYYKPLKSNSINQIGFGLHQKIAIDFLEKARQTIINYKNRDEAIAYILGFICHFMLDSECHGYIGDKINNSGITHAEIEVEFDRYLLVKQNKNPIKTKLTEHIIINKENAECIECFYDGASDKEVFRALKSMKHYNNLLCAPGKLKRKIVLMLLKLSGNHKEMSGLLMNYEANPQCIDSSEELQRRLSNIVLSTVALMKEYYENIGTSEQLNKRFRKNFE